ncbi:MAG: hypothetical protein EOO52_04425 [Gammaproteobacteria bacterium]|nr:MAG: hypothetical protein EOO52_04425 [Gammaproteobacteria bacterium]
MLSAEISTTLADFAQWLILVSLKTLPLIILVLLLQRIFRKFLSASANYLLWLPVMISLCVPFGWQLHVMPIMASVQTPATIIANVPVIRNLSAVPANEDFLPQNKSVFENDITSSAFIDIKNKISPKRFSLTNNIFYIFSIFWLLGTSVFLILITTRTFQFRRIKKNATSIHGEIFELLNACKKEMGLNKSIQLLSTDAIQSPVTVGWINPSIILPKNLTHRAAPTKLKHVLLHEVGHIKRHDIFFNWIICLVNILHWFNPIVWLACRNMRKDMEMACDALVLSRLDRAQRKSYGETLIEISEIPRVSPRVQTTLGMFENHNELKQRLHMIKDFTTMNIKNSIFFTVILTATAITSLAQPNSEANDKTTSAPPAKVSDASPEDIGLRDFAKFAEKELKMKVLVGQNYAKNSVQVNMGEPLDYGKFLTQLKINEFTAYKSKDYIQIIPLRDARSFSIPVVEKGKAYFEDEVVTDYLTTDKSCAAQVLAVVRPLVPQYAHLSSDNRHTLIIIDTFGNIQRIRSAIKTLEVNLDAPVDCENIVPPPFRPNPAKQAENK